MKRISLHESILATHAYADIFSHTLSDDELHRWLIGRKSKKKVRPVSLVNTRRVEKMARIYGFIPTVRFVGITGSLAMGNAGSGEDIDLFFIVTPGCMWVTRLLVIVLTDVFARRRKAGDRVVGGKICLNMFITEQTLTMKKNDRNLYIAHEILQMQPLLDRGVYRKFLGANRWVREFLPNAWEYRWEKFQISNIKYPISNYGLSVFTLLEPIAKRLQLWHMRKRRTTEIISDDVLRFHPRDTKGWIEGELAKRLNRYNIPLDKVFGSRIK